MRTVKTILPCETIVNTQEKHICRPFPGEKQGSLDPFVLLDDFSIQAPGGFLWHPHIGFEKITYLLCGGLMHTDSIGNEKRILSGGAHRLRSGKQVYHSEMPVDEFSTRGIQLWVNLPKSMKEAEPSFQDVREEELPTHVFSGGSCKVIVGDGSPITIQTAMCLYDVSFDTIGEFCDEIPDGYTVFVYPISGRGRMPGSSEMEPGCLYLLNDEGICTIEGLEGFRALVVAGLPHRDPIHVWGPYVG